MADDDKTRRVGSGSQGDPMKTRLVRRDNVEASTPRPALAGRAAEGQPKTRMFLRPRGLPEELAEVSVQAAQAERFVTGWLVVVQGPGRGNFAPIFDGMNSVGRDEDQATIVDFGDEAISRNQHAFITYDFKSRNYYLQHGGKASLVRLNDTPVLQPCELKSEDLIALGETTFRFIALCGATFDWQD